MPRDRLEGRVHAVFLDYATVDMNDLDPAALRAAVSRLDLHEDTPLPDLGKRLAGAQVAIVNKLPLRAPLLTGLSQLRLVCLAATGTDNVDIACARERGVAVCNLRDYCTDSVAQHVFALILTLARRLDDYRAIVRDGRWSRSATFCLLERPIADLHGRTLCIVGYGVLGRAVARLGEAFGMHVRIAARPGAVAGAGRVAFDAALREADVLSVHCPLTESTRGLFDAAALATMKPTALLINTARGAVVDSRALCAALRAGRLGGAGIDVLASEPPPADEPLLDATVPNLIVTPHVAWASVRARQQALDEIARNIVAFASGEARNRVC